MRVNEAVKALTEIACDVTLSTSELRDRMRTVLDAVWVEAYEEGRLGLFDGPQEVD